MFDQFGETHAGRLLNVLLLTVRGRRDQREIRRGRIDRSGGDDRRLGTVG